MLLYIFHYTTICYAWHVIINSSSTTALTWRIIEKLIWLILLWIHKCICTLVNFLISLLTLWYIVSKILLCAEYIIFYFILVSFKTLLIWRRNTRSTFWNYSTNIHSLAYNMIIKLSCFETLLTVTAFHTNRKIDHFLTHF